MQRTPEPELMTDATQALAYARADFAEPHENFVRLFREHLGARPVAGTALDLGCGTADVTWRFARDFSDVVVDGVDGSTAMLKHGRELVSKHGLNSRVTLIEGYLPGAKLPRERYDFVISNSLLHHLKNPLLIWDLCKAYGKPGAGIFVMDLMRPASEAEAARLVQTYAANEHEFLKTDFYHSLLAAYTVEEVREQLRASDLSELRVLPVSDRHLIVTGRLPG